jgi:hypothetical protein
MRREGDVICYGAWIVFAAVKQTNETRSVKWQKLYRR